MRTILSAKKINKSYRVNNKENHVLNNVSLDIMDGEFISVMGPSGSGKSTLLYNISSMDKMDSGEIVFDNDSLEKSDEKTLSDVRLRKMGFVFQQFNLLKNLGIVDNIVFPAHMTKNTDKNEALGRAYELMEKTGISDLKENSINEASGGQLQRVAICRALINNPKIVFGDEPTGALNSKSANEIMDIFEDINNSGTTIMLVTHDVKVAARTKRVLFMKDGEILDQYKFGNDIDLPLKEKEKKLQEWLLETGW